MDADEQHPTLPNPSKMLAARENRESDMRFETKPQLKEPVSCLAITTNADLSYGCVMNGEIERFQYQLERVFCHEGNHFSGAICETLVQISLGCGKEFLWQFVGEEWLVVSCFM
ncbi:hypothetical protein AVEN_175621-1 [Araneus ventricosus]|uniref:Uncharacterized protein n=1 Tax=Araneus ventricosus TaxID=182803 RepID=A0A4Y2KXR3_ARAVE|nr:hypothetical protein AVEN_175621-1 [Araneus ventricosus]